MFVSRTVSEIIDVTFTSVIVDEVWSRSGVKRINVEARLLGKNSFAREIVFRVCVTHGF